jgi:GNAT superfamily N-acetyltransferase
MNAPKFQITPFHPRFEHQVKDLVGKLLVHTGVIQESDLPIDDEDLGKIPEVYSGKGKFWVAIIGDHVVGTVGIKDEGNHVAKLKRMFVLPEYHGKGVGEALLAHAEAYAKKQGFTKLILNTDTKMHRACHFYEKHGFVQIEEFHCDEQSLTSCRLHYEKEL